MSNCNGCNHGGCGSNKQNCDDCDGDCDGDCGGNCQCKPKICICKLDVIMNLGCQCGAQKPFKKRFK